MTPDYSTVHHNLTLNGQYSPSRFGPTRELLNVQTSFGAGELVNRPGFSMKLAMVELLQVLAGTFSLDHIKLVAPNARHELFTLSGAYGPRLADQLPNLIDHLRAKPNSRQAVMFIGSKLDSFTDLLPCTVSYQVLYRNRALHAYVTMRSWDVTTGLPYDIVVFGGLLQAIGLCLKTRAASVTVTAASYHMYEDYPPEWRNGSNGGFFYLPLASWTADPSAAWASEWSIIRSTASSALDELTQYGKAGWKPPVFVEQ